MVDIAMSPFVLADVDELRKHSLPDSFSAVAHSPIFSTQNTEVASASLPEADGYIDGPPVLVSALVLVP